MQRIYRTTAGFLTVAILAAACADNAPTEQASPLTTPQVQPTSIGAAQGIRTFDDDFVALSRNAPGFGGLFYDATGTLTVYLKDPSLRGSVSAPIVAFLARNDANGFALRAAEVARMIVRRADYDFAELAAIYARALPIVAADEAVTLTDIDETRNRIVIGVKSSAAAERVRGLLAQTGAPEEAVIVETAPSVDVQATLQGLVRPVVAAVQVNRQTGTLGACTLSFNAAYRNDEGAYDGHRYFVTNSHCTNEFGVNNSDGMGQPDMSSPIGTEVADPALFDSSVNPSCPAGLMCRWSDAALFRYDAEVTWTYGTFPTVGTAAPFTITGYKNISYIDGPWIPSLAYLYAGLSIAKTGRTTGKTTGNILNTCVGLRQYDAGVPTGRFLFCQFQATGLNSGGGDSGSPVYHLDAQGNMNPLLGVFWGTSYNNDVVGAPIRATFSHLYYVTFELKTAMGGGWLDMGKSACNPNCPPY